MDSNSPDYSFKIVISGNTEVGKSSVLKRYSNNKFNFNSINTIGVDLILKNINYNNKIFKLQLWDTAGQERFRSIASSYYKGCDGVIFAYDITSMDSFKQIIYWINSYNEDIGNGNDNTQSTTHDDDNIVKMLIGNKCDLEKEREVSYESGKILANQYKMMFFETSALNNTNIDEMFEAMVKRYYEQIGNEQNQLSGIIIINNNVEDIAQSTKLCCK